VACIIRLGVREGAGPTSTPPPLALPVPGAPPRAQHDRERPFCQPAATHHSHLRPPWPHSSTASLHTHPAGLLLLTTARSAPTSRLEFQSTAKQNGMQRRSGTTKRPCRSLIRRCMLCKTVSKHGQPASGYNVVTLDMKVSRTVGAHLGTLMRTLRLGSRAGNRRAFQASVVLEKATYDTKVVTV
jgi:hypothetical protein